MIGDFPEVSFHQMMMRRIHRVVRLIFVVTSSQSSHILNPRLFCIHYVQLNPITYNQKNISLTPFSLTKHQQR